MNRRQFITLVGTAAWQSAAAAQQPPTIGLLSATELSEWATKAIAAGLAETGYVEGRNLTILYRLANGQFDRLPAMASDLVSSKVSIIFAMGSPVPARVAKAATTTIPIVFAYGGDPIADGLVGSYSRPGGNVTGATFIGAAMTSKRMELLREIVPTATDFALLVNPKGTLATVQIADAQAAARSLGQRLHIFNASTVGEIDTAFAAMHQSKVDALLVSTDPFFGFTGGDRVVELASRDKIPAIYNGRVKAEAGGLVSYGARLPDTWRQAAVYAGRILKGEKPWELPVMEPVQFEMVINLKAAKQIGLDISPALLSRADAVIE